MRRRSTALALAVLMAAGRARAGDDADPIVALPELETPVEAAYPPEALAAGREGVVELEVELDVDGVPTSVRVVTPAGDGFDEAALEAVRRMRFRPARTAEGPVPVVFPYTYRFVLPPPPPPAEAAVLPVTVEGVVRGLGGGRPVPGVSVRVDADGEVAVTGADGRFAFRGIAPGVHALHLRHPDFLEEEDPVTVVAGEVSEATVWLRAKTYRANESVGYYDRARTEVTRHTLSMDEVRRVPGTFGDPVRAVTTLPGAGRPPFGRGQLIIRGANPQDTNVYVDGVRIPIVFHLTGLTSVLSPDLVKSVDYLPGGYGVQYGRAMAGTVDVQTKDRLGNADGSAKISAGVDVLDAQVWFEGNVGRKDGPKHGLAIGFRQSLVQLFLPLLAGKQDVQARPTYLDYQLKWIPPTGPKDKFSAFVFGFRDRVAITATPGRARGSDPATQGGGDTSYQAHRLVLRWQHAFSDRLSLDLRPSVGVDLEHLDLGGRAVDVWDVLGQLRAELSYRPHPAVELVPGVDFMGGPYGFTYASEIGFTNLDDPLGEHVPIGFTGKGTAWYTAPYLKVNLRPLADRDRWILTPGIRYDSTVFVVKGTITDGQDVGNTVIHSVDPRIGTRLVVFEKGDMAGAIKGSTGLYSQPPQPYQAFGLGTTAQVHASRSWNSEIGFEHQVSQAVSWSLVGFYRGSYDLLVSNPDFEGFGAQPFTNLGDGRAYGAELILRHAPIGRFFGWISYTFSRSFRRDAPQHAWRPYTYDQPHILSAQGGYNLPFDLGISAQIQVVSGNPTTIRNAGIYDADGNSYDGIVVGHRNDARLPTFVQTSFRIDKTFTFRHAQLDLYLDLVNAIHGVNPEGLRYSYDYSQYAYVRGLPFIPNLGIEVRGLP